MLPQSWPAAVAMLSFLLERLIAFCSVKVILGPFLRLSFAAVDKQAPTALRGVRALSALVVAASLVELVVYLLGRTVLLLGAAIYLAVLINVMSFAAELSPTLQESGVLGFLPEALQNVLLHKSLLDVLLTGASAAKQAPVSDPDDACDTSYTSYLTKARALVPLLLLPPEERDAALAILPPELLGRLRQPLIKSTVPSSLQSWLRPWGETAVASAQTPNQQRIPPPAAAAHRDLAAPLGDAEPRQGGSAKVPRDEPPRDEPPRDKLPRGNPPGEAKTAATAAAAAAAAAAGAAGAAAAACGNLVTRGNTPAAAADASAELGGELGGEPSNKSGVGAGAGARAGARAGDRGNGPRSKVKIRPTDGDVGPSESPSGERADEAQQSPMQSPPSLPWFLPRTFAPEWLLLCAGLRMLWRSLRSKLESLSRCACKGVRRRRRSLGDAARLSLAAKLWRPLRAATTLLLHSVLFVARAFSPAWLVRWIGLPPKPAPPSSRPPPTQSPTQSPPPDQVRASKEKRGVRSRR